MRLKAVVRGDTATLDLLLDDDYSLTEPSGEVISKAEEIGEIKAPAFLVYKACRAEDVKVEVSGDGATVSGLAVLSFLLDGQDVSRRYRYERTFAGREAGWRITSARMISAPPDEN